MTRVLGCIVIVVSCCSMDCAIAQTNYQRIKSFGFPGLSATTPTTAPIEASDGRIYGTAETGGTNGFGAIYSLNKDGSDYIEIHSFPGSDGNGLQLSRLREASDGALYGTTTIGGSSNVGSVYKVAKDGSDFTTLISFKDHNGDGGYPFARVAEGSDGALYGTTQAGGVNDVGTVYKINKDGTGYRVLLSFSATGQGPRQPGGLIASSDGALYGTSTSGGSNNLGTVYKLSQNGTGLGVLRTFTGAPGDGAVPIGELLEGSDGVIYGTTLRGGATNEGTIFRLNKDGTAYRVLRSFSLTTTSGQEPRSALVEGSDGTLYGAAYGATLTLGNDSGTLFRINKDGTGYQDIWSFSPGPGGTKPFGLVAGNDRTLYGTAQMWGSRRAGTVFKVANDGTGFGVLHTFSPDGGDGEYPQASVLSASDGKLYGTTSSGGAEDLGTIFSCNNDGSGYTVLKSFSFADGDGQFPRGALIDGRDGILYGTTEKGGAKGFGTVYKINKNGNDYGILRSFTFENGEAYDLWAGLLEGGDGALYGTTRDGGAGGYGVVFKLQKDGSGYVVLRDFTAIAVDGANPLTALIEGQDGALYGTTPNGGTNNTGTLFKLNKDGSGYAVLHSFSFATGEYPGQVMQGSEGALYGAANFGGSGSGGAVYTIKSDGTGFRVLHNFLSTDFDGFGPGSVLLETPDGFLYGTTVGGSSGIDVGNIFRLNKDGSGYQVVRRFMNTAGDGREPQGGLVLASDGSLAGVTLQGGDMNFGTIFKVRLPPTILVAPSDQSVAAGSEVTMTWKVMGSQPLSYQWQQNGTNIAGATNFSFVISSVQTKDAGSYTVVVMNDLGTATSTPAILRVNNPPVADASATSTLLLSPNGTNAVVVLDGSRSFDSDGDPLQYLWLAEGSINPVATGVVAIVVLPVGTNSISLVVSDGAAKATNTIAIEVITAAQLVERLVAAVQSDVSRSHPLIATLSAAIASVDRSNPTAAINQLEVFQNQVQVQVEPIDSELARTLNQTAQDVIDNLSNGGIGAAKTQFTGLVKQNNGKIRIQFSTPFAKIHIVAASTNMMDWDLIGVAANRGDGVFEFEDSTASRFTTRFYRILSP